ncbi:hypothetical protein DVH24_013381 [Malus domestica]|uniref:Uncharacterized protein n=1 Tax=Malus domestica TaxID=3750 RepID=A0A498HM73_MALDO|nr:hypothetical protein DVH24_013381 [Malus domestica]
MSYTILNHFIALSKLEIQVDQIVQTLNEQQSGSDYQEEKEEQPKEACCAYFHSEVPEFYKDEEPYTPSKPYVPPVPFPRRFVKQKHDEPPIDVPYLESLGDDLLPYQEENELKVRPIHHKKEDLELDDEIAALNEFCSSLVANNSSIEIIAPTTSLTIFEDMVLHKER